jgi:hypothetical protein
VKTAVLATALTIAALGTATAVAVETVRVDASSGVPLILVDGKPVRARMFWGGPGTRPLPIAPKAQAVDFEFTPTHDEPSKATMHFRFGQKAGDVYLDDIRVVEVETGREVIPQCTFEQGLESFNRHWTIFPPKAQNTVGTVQVEPGCGRDGSAGLHIKLTAPAAGQWPDFHIYHHANLALRKGQHYRVTFWIRATLARELTVAFYRPGDPFLMLGGLPSSFGAQIKLAVEAGAQFISFPVGLPWPKPGQPVDWSAVDSQCQAVLDAHPKALLLPRLPMDPPAWWCKEHPDDVMVWDKTRQGRTVAVVASPVYRREAAERLAALIAHLEEKFGAHTAGYHPCGQNTGEWFYEDTWDSALSGYAPADLQAWRTWLKARYRDDASLRAAWNDAHATLDSVAVPSPASRRATPAGIFRDPVAERSQIDFTEFQQQMMADCVCHFARTVRQATGGKKLVVFFYGYVFEFGAVRNGPATAGHYALRRALECPEIDVLCSPISYFDRALGQNGPSMTAAESVALAGKMWLYEDDTRTYISGQTTYSPVATLEGTQNVLLRNTGQCALRNFGTWWMDLGSAGWFNDPQLWVEMKRLAALDQPLLERPRPFRPEVAAVIDDPSMMRVAFGGQEVTRPGVYEVRQPLGRMGTPCGQYLLDDVVAGRVSAKMYVFLTAWTLTPGERQQLLTKTRGSLRIWCYAPGYHDGYRTSLEAMRELTGFQLKSVSGITAQAEPTETGTKLGLVAGFGVNKPIQPLFAAADAKPEETLARYADGSAAVALRKTADGWSLFVGPPGLTSDLLRLAAKKAGVHLFTQADCNTYANGPYLVLHASQDGPMEIDTGKRGVIRDVLTGKVIGQGPKLSLTLKKGDTWVLATETP